MRQYLPQQWMDALLVPTQHPGREVVCGGQGQQYQGNSQAVQGDFNGKSELLFFVNEAALALEMLFFRHRKQPGLMTC